MSGKVNMGNTTAALEGDAVVLLIGMRINHFWAVHHWLPVMVSMFRMLSELKKDRSRGLLGHVLLTGSPRSYYVVQYWKTKEQLYSYAASPQMFHHRVWKYINRKQREGKVPGHVGLWHESYVSPEGSYESIYAYMPPYGLSAATGAIPVERRGRTAKERFAHRSAPARP
ncbi:hypothetical protein GCM10010329_26870 [Streptomyces spiroverticillatus]|uniref:DUF4188 domain-containing protein n=1 Tax=Streptomyces finlayi TaxID=67296 RepID=A0A918WVL1_9ACTN|nr:DUF4188 domain-containing protein [Streptomyces finlayi]GHA03252.1 hypothetical protein GCM10010329_26870 [Streptomyces spiroverticillatus]GHC87408.1 hypothetical protein GCM10010334_19280 [Streptomyces finlayi]